MIMRWIRNETEGFVTGRTVALVCRLKNVRQWLKFINESCQRYAEFLIRACSEYLNETDAIIVTPDGDR